MEEKRSKGMHSVSLSKRLSCVAQMVSPGACVCDVGCDHGFVSIYLVQSGIAGHVLAMDVRKGPLSRAAEHVQEYGLCDYIEVRLSDGLAAVRDGERIDTAIMAGMGGLLMVRLIEDACKRGLRIPELVLQPQSQWQQLRCFLRQSGYRIAQEDMILEEGKFYPVLRAVAGQTDMSDRVEKDRAQDAESVDMAAVGDLFGPLLLQAQNAVLRQYLLREKKKFQTIRERIAQNGRCDASVEKQLVMLDMALQMFAEEQQA